MLECHTLILIALAEVCVLRVLFYSWCVDCSGYRGSSPARTEAVRDTGRTWRRPVSGVLSSVDRHRPTTSGSFAWLSRFVSCLQSNIGQLHWENFISMKLQYYRYVKLNPTEWVAARRH